MCTDSTHPLLKFDQAGFDTGRVIKVFMVAKTCRLIALDLRWRPFLKTAITRVRVEKRRWNFVCRLPHHGALFCESFKFVGQVLWEKVTTVTRYCITFIFINFKVLITFLILKVAQWNFNSKRARVGATKLCSGNFEILPRGEKWKLGFVEKFFKNFFLVGSIELGTAHIAVWSLSRYDIELATWNCRVFFRGKWVSKIVKKSERVQLEVGRAERELSSSVLVFSMGPPTAQIRGVV